MEDTNAPSPIAGSKHVRFSVAFEADHGLKQNAKYELLSKSFSHNSSRTNSRLNPYVLGCTLLASLNSILLGYDIGIMSGAVLFIKEDMKLTEGQEEILVGSLNLVSLFGGLISGRISDLVGRKKTMAIASVIFLLGAAVMGLAPSFSMLMFGRLLAGIGVGFALMIAPVYTAELSPTESRGALVSLPEIFINVGILLGYVVSYLLAGYPTGLAWRLMLGVGAVPAIVLACGVLVMPESPRWLVMQGKIDEAKFVLSKTSTSIEEAAARLSAIESAAGLSETSLDSGYVVPAKNSHGEGVWKELLCPTAPVRRMLVVALGIQFFQQASGIDALVYYSPAVYKEAGIRSKAGLLGTTAVMGLTKTLFILVATGFLDRIGRRPLLLLSSIGMTISLGILAFGFMFLDVRSIPDDDSVSSVAKQGPIGAIVLAIAAICLFMAFFSVGFGPVCWVLTSEIFPLRLRAQSMSLGIVVNRVVSGTVALTFLSISDAITPAGGFFLFSCVAAASVFFVYFLVPETKGRSLEDISRFFGWDDASSLEKTEMIEVFQPVETRDHEFVDGECEVHEEAGIASKESLLDKVRLISRVTS